MKKIICFIIYILIISLPLNGAANEPITGMFDLYEQNRKKNIPNYITQDFILLSYSMLINESITQMEENILYPEYKILISALIEKIKSITPKNEITQANLNYLEVINALLSEADSFENFSDNKLVSQELQAVLKADGILESKLMLQKIDYTQFKVRGKYTQTKQLGRYFQAMRYAGTVLFPVLESKATGITSKKADRLTRQAAALVQLIDKNSNIKKIYNNLNEKLNWLFGPPDDLSLEDYIQVIEKISDKPIAEIRKQLFDFAVKQEKQPSIMAGIIDATALKKQGKKPADVMTGFRLMPLRFTPDSAAFQKLIYNETGKYKGNQSPFSKALIDGKYVKGFPMGLELMALLGSKEAQKRLKDSDDQNYEGYVTAYKQAQQIIKKPAGMATDHLNLMSYWLKNGKDGTRLNTCLGFWTYLRYINVLYAKQSYTSIGKSLIIPKKRSSAWLEPAPQLYIDLKKQTEKFTAQVNNDFIKDDFITNLKAFISILETCHEISILELKNQPLSEKQISFLNQLDLNLLNLIGERDRPIIVDIHTEPNSSKVLEQALGYPQIVFHKMDLEKTRGALFNYYEFKYKNRLNNEQWHILLKDVNAIKNLLLSCGTTR